jgi:hypothetical protein
MSESEERKDQESIGPKSVGLTGQIIGSSRLMGQLTAWRSYSFAPEWYRDAQEQAQFSDHTARRKEIVFAVCTAESYLLEWVRDTVLARDFKALDAYFPPAVKRPILEKWKEIPKRLREDGRIPGTPDLGGSTWSDFRKLIDFRDGLVHARSSRPETAGLPEESLPLPSKSELDNMEPGWALRTISRLIADLNAAAATDDPDWLIKEG